MNPRRIIHWDRVRGPKAWFAIALGTAGGAGLAPFAPGSAGTLMGIPIAWEIAGWEPGCRALVWLALLAAGTWAAQWFDGTMGSKDNQNIVMDEVVGFGITAWTAGSNWQTLLAAFVLFRIFDIIKIPPVRWADEWSKKGDSPWRGGFGVMLDDVLAGFQGLAVILALQWQGWLP